jgi:hypothetical protein
MAVVGRRDQVVVADRRRHALRVVPPCRRWIEGDVRRVAEVDAAPAEEVALGRDEVADDITGGPPLAGRRVRPAVVGHAGEDGAQ